MLRDLRVALKLCFSPLPAQILIQTLLHVGLRFEQADAVTTFELMSLSGCKIIVTISIDLSEMAGWKIELSLHSNLPQLKIEMK
jgi:hypothetical protein